MTILLVDDNPSDAQLVREILARQDPGLLIINAETCEEAVHVAETANIDCIVMDQALIGTQGSECVKQLRAKEYRGGFILVTGFSDPVTAVDAMRNGADNYLSKNDLAGLLPAIHKAVEMRQDSIRAQQAVVEKEQRYVEQIAKLHDERRSGSDQQILIEAVSDIQNIRVHIATLMEKTANIEANNQKQFDMLVKMQESWQNMLLKLQQSQVTLKTTQIKQTTTRWKIVGQWIIPAIATIETVALAYLAYLELIAKK